MRIILIHPALEDFYSTPIRFYPLGLLYVAAVLQRCGHTVAVLDCLTPRRRNKKSVPPELQYLQPLFRDNPYLFQAYYRFGAEDEDTFRRVQAWRPDLIGISSQFTAYFDQTASLARLLHQRLRVPMILGGHHATAFSAEIQERLPFVHRVLTGPAESALPAFLQESGHDAAEAVEWRDLTPAHDLAPEGAYRIGKKNGMSLVASRGCPFRCDFCSVHAMFDRGISYRPVAAVIDEMRWNLIHKKVRVFNFEDDNLSWDRSWFIEFLHAVQKDPELAQCELTAMNGLSHGTLDEELLLEMKKAGFRQLNLAYVTGDTGLQKKYHRPGQVDFTALTAAARRLGFFVTAYVIIGLPEQTYSEIKESIDYLLSLGVLVGPSVFYIPPASALYRRLPLTDAMRSQWSLYRSSAFAVETEHVTREQLVELFAYCRRRNLEQRENAKYIAANG